MACRVLSAMLCILLFPTVSEAQALLAQTVDSIRIEGNQRIEPETIHSYMSITVGNPFDPVQIDNSLKALFDTGLFADVAITQDGATLVVRVVENPVINRITFEGNFSINDEILSSEISLRPRVVFTRSKLQEDVQRILGIYQRSGRFAAVINPQVVFLEQNRLDLIFEINEGRLRECGGSGLSEMRHLTTASCGVLSKAEKRDGGGGSLRMTYMIPTGLAWIRNYSGATMPGADTQTSA